MEFKDIIGKPIKLKLKTGKVLSGWVQEPADISMLNTAIPFLTIEKQQKLKERSGNQKQIAIPIHESTNFIKIINVTQIESFELIETNLSNIHLVTEGGKQINIEGFQVELKGTGKPGRLTVSYKLPENEKSFDLGELEIKEGALHLPVILAFISYAKEDYEKVLSITSDLNDKGILTWFDKRMLLPGDDWQHRIEQAIEEADYFILFLSSQTIDRVGYKNRELQLALYQQSLRPVGKRFIVPILLDDCKTPRDLEKLNWLKVTRENWFDILLKAIAPFYIKQKLYK